MTEMTLYWCPRTRASRAVWMLEEVSADYDLMFIDIRDEESKADPEFRIASPMGKVPALKHGDMTMTDSTAIIAYLAELYPDAGLAPPVGDPMRGPYLQWLIFGGAYIEPAMTEAFGSTTPNATAHGWGNFELTIDMLREGLKQGPWILGDKFCAADVMLGSSVYFMRMFGVLPDHADLHAYVDRCLERPAYAKALKIDSDAMPD
ncbi:MAG: glutathione S-transferase family protein [Hyphomonadaceae bacterium]